MTDLVVVNEGAMEAAERQTKLLADRAKRSAALLFGIIITAILLETLSRPRPKETLDAKVVLRECLAPLVKQAESKGVAIEMDLAANLPLVTIDSFRFPWVITNLVGNALRYTSSGGRITLRVFKQGARFYFQCADTGSGIDPKYLPHIFDRFTQFSNRGKSGTIGLGLAIVKDIIEQHGGDIQANSNPRAVSPDALKSLAEIEKQYIQMVILHTASLEEAARVLGIDPATLWRKRKKYQEEYPSFDPGRGRLRCCLTDLALEKRIYFIEFCLQGGVPFGFSLLQRGILALSRRHGHLQRQPDAQHHLMRLDCCWRTGIPGALRFPMPVSISPWATLQTFDSNQNRSSYHDPSDLRRGSNVHSPGAVFPGGHAADAADSGIPFSVGDQQDSGL